MKSIPKTNISFNFYHLPTSTVLDRKANTTKLYTYAGLRPAQVFSCEFCEISKNTFLTEHLRTAASVTNLTVSRVAFVYHSKASI